MAAIFTQPGPNSDLASRDSRLPVPAYTGAGAGRTRSVQATNSQPRLLCCASMLANFAACHDRLNVARIPGSPLAKRSQRLSQGFPKSREGIFDLRGYLSEINTIDDPVRPQFLELLDQHFVTDAA